MAVCKHCGGNGICTKCAGTGKQFDHPCKACGGSGNCPACNGTGETP